MRVPIPLLCLFLTSPVFAQQGDKSAIDQSRVPPEWEIPSAPVLTPEEALETFELQPGFRIELVASEPLVNDPVAIDFDEDGRIWVVEMRSFMPDVDGHGELEPVNRIVVLEDTDEDGRMDSSSVYMEGLVLPRSIRVMEGGVLVGEPPYLWFTRDTDGDGRADEKTMVADDYSRRGANPEHAANGLLLGIDNWVHNAMYDKRYRLIDGEWVHEPTISRGQWGISQDNLGRHYTNTNSYQLYVDHVADHYYPRNPNMDSRYGVYSRMNEDRSVWPIRITPGINRRAQLSPEGFLENFTAACSPLIYRGDNFPADFVGNAFVAEPAGHLIRRSVIREDANGVLHARNAYDQEEFLASTDERFRPVGLYNAPDGTLYIVDMYRGILQHRQFVTTYLRRQILARGLEEPLGLGRIYRVVHESTEPAPAPRMSQASSEELVKHLAHPNGWWRDTAQRLLVERQDAAVIPLLREMAAEHENELARVHALWTLEGVGGLEKSLLVKAMDAASRDVRVTALRVAEGFLRTSPEGGIGAKAIELTFDEDPTVRLYAALALGELPDSDIKRKALADLLERHTDQPFLRQAVLSGLANGELEFLQEITGQPEWADEGRGRADVIEAFSAAVMREGDMDRIGRLFDLIGTDAIPDWQRLAILEGIDESEVKELPSRPANFTLASSDSAVARRAAEVLGRLEFAAEEPEKPIDADLARKLARGADQFEFTCASCHQSNGQGVEGLAVPLVGSEWVLGKEENLIRILLHGKEGEEGLMPPLGAGMSDEDVAAILTYIRHSWGNQADAVDATAVAEIRENTGRRGPWTEPELRKQ